MSATILGIPTRRQRQSDPWVLSEIEEGEDQYALATRVDLGSMGRWKAGHHGCAEQCEQQYPEVTSKGYFAALPLDVYWRLWTSFAYPCVSQGRAPRCEHGVWAFHSSLDAETHAEPPLAHIKDALAASRWMLELPDDWDGEGSPGYSQETWMRAARYVVGIAERLWESSRTPLLPPKVQNGPDGSIDIHWDVAAFELLINIPADPGEPIECYGRNAHGQEVKGPLREPSIDDWLLVWLRESCPSVVA